MDDTCDRHERATLDARGALAALGLLAVVLVPTQWRSGGPVSAVLVLGAIGALHWARVRSLPALGSAMVLLLGAYVVTDGRQLVPTVLVLLVVALSWWSGSRHVGLVVTALATVFNVLVALRIADLGGPRGGPPVSATVAGGLLSALLAAAALAGSVVRVRGQYHRELEARARQLEVERDQQARIAVAEERRRIAREMHDVVAHSITVMVRLSEGVLAGNRPREEQEAVALRALAETGRSSLAEMRRVLGVLADATDATAGTDSREPQPAVADLPRLVERFRAAGLDVVADVDGTFDGWGPGAELAVYRIAQEALTNALRHAPQGCSAQLSVRADADTIEVQVSDDGAGTPAGAAAPDTPGGRGLAGMAQRVAAWDGDLAAGPMEPHGWRVHAVLRRVVP